VLCHVAQTIKYTVRSSDYVARLGGDEFAVIMENCSQPNIASDIAEAIIARLSIPIAVAENIYVTIGASIGIALCDSHYQTLEQLFDHADKALYSAKEAGRNCLRIADQNRLLVL
jgi:diguanylate cyclase (GGDEF)-like protein